MLKSACTILTPMSCRSPRILCVSAGPLADSLATVLWMCSAATLTDLSPLGGHVHPSRKKNLLPPILLPHMGHLEVPLSYSQQCSGLASAYRSLRETNM